MKLTFLVGIIIITLTFISFVFVATVLFLCVGYIITQLFSLSLFEATLLSVIVGIMTMLGLSALLARSNSIYSIDDEDDYEDD